MKTTKKTTAIERSTAVAKTTVTKQSKKVSKTWLAFLKAAENPGEILDMRAVLK